MSRRRDRREDPTVKMSKALSWVLRHGAEKVGLAIGSDGYVKVEDLLKVERIRGLTMPQLEEMVRTNAKQRFQLSTNAAGEPVIRATQGHTIASVSEEALLTPITDASEIPLCVHGTFNKFWPSIAATGLNKMTRNHIHLTTAMPGDKAVMSGSRSDANVAIVLDVPAAMAAGIKFWRSTNGVILTPGMDGVVAPKYFKRVVRMKRGVEQEELPFSKDGGSGSGSGASAGAGAGGGASDGAGGGAAAGTARSRAAELAALIPGTKEYAEAASRRS